MFELRWRISCQVKQHFGIIWPFITHWGLMTVRSQRQQAGTGTGLAAGAEVKCLWDGVCG